MVATLALPSPAQAATSHAFEAMPNFIGLGRSGVYSEMFSAQLYFKTTGAGANSSQWVRVVSEIPAAGTPIHPFSTVILQVTTAPDPVVVTAVRRVIATPTAAKKSPVRVAAAPRPLVRRPVTTVTRTSRPRVVGAREGVATWYSYIPGQCASWYLPHGTRINVEDLATHRVISCVITDREAAHGDRVVDLSETQFAQLAPLGVGVVPVRVTW